MLDLLSTRADDGYALMGKSLFRLFSLHEIQRFKRSASQPHGLASNERIPCGIVIGIRVQLTSRLDKWDSMTACAQASESPLVSTLPRSVVTYGVHIDI